MSNEDTSIMDDERLIKRIKTTFKEYAKTELLLKAKKGDQMSLITMFKRPITLIAHQTLQAETS